MKTIAAYDAVSAFSKIGVFDKKPNAAENANPETIAKPKIRMLLEDRPIAREYIAAVSTADFASMCPENHRSKPSGISGSPR